MFIYKNGFTLIENLIVLLILAIFSVLIIPKIAFFSDTIKERMCYSNCEIIERAYETYLVLGEHDHTDMGFKLYMLKNNYEICPEDGVVYYIDGEVYCSMHNELGKNEDEDNEQVTFL